MRSINRVEILGNVTKDPEMRYTPNGHPVINFSIATNRQWSDKDTGEKKEAVEYHNVVFWGKAAEIIDQYVNKGSKLYVQGRLQTRSWDKDGIKRYTTEVIGEDFIFLSPKGEFEDEVVVTPASVDLGLKNGLPDEEVVDQEVADLGMRESISYEATEKKIKDADLHREKDKAEEDLADDLPF